MAQELVRVLNSADELRYLLDRGRGDNCIEQAVRVRAEAHLLQQLTRSAAQEQSEYSALIAGLADFARRAEEQLDTSQPV